MKPVRTRDGRELSLQKLQLSDHHLLSDYLNGLSADTRKRFGPHPFDPDSIRGFYDTPKNIGFIAVEPSAGKIVAYSVVKIGFLWHDQPRLESYGLTLDHYSDACFAPSVSDQWQSMGIGDLMLTYILDELRAMNIHRLILWGGVQMDNERAVNYYRKNGFVKLGQFEYNGWNLDMMREL
ncbi:MAG TPA: N-acetyltransferase [Chitinophagaceae bacterium]|nr:N-acetyltransferase [Chitinophagaceae bacterium]